MLETYASPSTRESPKTNYEIFVDYLKLNWFIGLILAIVNIGAGFALCGLFVGKKLELATNTDILILNTRESYYVPVRLRV